MHLQQSVACGCGCVGWAVVLLWWRWWYCWVWWWRGERVWGGGVQGPGARLFEVGRGTGTCAACQRGLIAAAASWRRQESARQLPGPALRSGGPGGRRSGRRSWRAAQAAAPPATAASPGGQALAAGPARAPAARHRKHVTGLLAHDGRDGRGPGLQVPLLQLGAMRREGEAVEAPGGRAQQQDVARDGEGEGSGPVARPPVQGQLDDGGEVAVGAEQGGALPLPHGHEAGGMVDGRHPFATPGVGAADVQPGSPNHDGAARGAAGAIHARSHLIKGRAPSEVPQQACCCCRSPRR